MNADDLTTLNEQIAAMARAGMPLDQGLASLAREMGRGRLRSVTEALAEDLRAGHPLPEALSRQKDRVPPYYANLVTIGVQTGRLPDVLATLTIYARSVALTRSTVIDALLYPMIIMVVGLSLFTALSIYILPEFDHIFQEFGMRLPWVTQIVMAVGRHPVEIIGIPLGVLTGTALAAWVWARRSPRGHRAATSFVYYIPLIGTIIRGARLAAFTDLLALLVEYGVALPAAFRLAGAASSDPNMTAQSERIEAELNQGESLAQALQNHLLLPKWAVWLIAAGDGRGGLAPALREVASLYRRQVDTRSSVLRNVLSPFIVIATTAVLVTIVAIAIFLPLVKLLEGLSK